MELLLESTPFDGYAIEFESARELHLEARLDLTFLFVSRLEQAIQRSDAQLGDRHLTERTSQIESSLPADRAPIRPHRDELGLAGRLDGAALTQRDGVRNA